MAMRSYWNHPFQEGTTIVTVEGRDLAGNTRRCHRTITVSDAEKPAWNTKEGSVDSDLTLLVDETCTRSAESIWREYEELGWAPEGTDNCGTTSIVKQIRKDGKVLVDDSAEESDMSVAGPGTYEVVYTITDAHDNHRSHTATLNLEDKNPGKFEVGVHPIKYPMKDAFGNLYPTECEFNIEVKPKAHPVDLTCPDDVVVTTLEKTGFGAEV